MLQYPLVRKGTRMQDKMSSDFLLEEYKQINEHIRAGMTMAVAVSTVYLTFQGIIATSAAVSLQNDNFRWKLSLSSYVISNNGVVFSLSILGIAWSLVAIYFAKRFMLYMIALSQRAIVIEKEQGGELIIRLRNLWDSAIFPGGAVYGFFVMAILVGFFWFMMLVHTLSYK